MKQYDYLIVGSGLFGSVFAYKAAKDGKRCLVIEKREHLGGNIYCENIEGINVHKYGPHIFHTSNKEVWDFVNSFVPFNNFILSPLANYKGALYNLPFNMNTFYEIWKTKTPSEAKQKIEEEKAKFKINAPKNLEEQAISLVGPTIYKLLIKGYTEKQWGRACNELPPFIIKRLPVRFTFNNNYFNDTYQGIPRSGYNKLTEALLKGIETKCRADFFDDKSRFESLAEKIVWSGKIDEYYGYKAGQLEYRTVQFETETLDCENYQGNAVINYTERDIPYTRVIEHKHFENGTQSKSVISREYPSEWKEGAEAMYPVNDAKNNALYEEYKQMAALEKNIIFGGRLAEYKYYDMDKVVEQALIKYKDCKNV